MPPEDLPTQAQREEAARLLRDDVALYEELLRRFDRRYRALDAERAIRGWLG